MRRRTDRRADRSTPPMLFQHWQRSKLSRRFRTRLLAARSAPLAWPALPLDARVVKGFARTQGACPEEEAVLGCWAALRSRAVLLSAHPWALDHSKFLRTPAPESSEAVINDGCARHAIVGVFSETRWRHGSHVCNRGLRPCSCKCSTTRRCASAPLSVHNTVHSPGPGLSKGSHLPMHVGLACRRRLRACSIEQPNRPYTSAARVTTPHHTHEGT